MLVRFFHGLPIAGLVVLGVAHGPAHAIDTGEKQVAVSLAFAQAGAGDSGHSGIQAGVEAAQGFTASWAGRGAASIAWQPRQASGGSRQITIISFGTTYSLDVVRWVPFLDLGVSLADWRGDGANSQRLGPQVGLGAEYLLSRHWTVAAFARFDYLAVRLGGPAGSYPWLACAGLRLGRVF